MIVQKKAPWEAFQPLAELEFRPFRDAGRGCADFNLSIQDCLWGMWKAMQNGLCDMNEFDVDDYEYYEKVENGDWNWITPTFIAFASPFEHGYVNNSCRPSDGPCRLASATKKCLAYSSSSSSQTTSASSTLSATLTCRCRSRHPEYIANSSATQHAPIVSFRLSR